MASSNQTYGLHSASWGGTIIPGCTGQAIEVGRAARRIGNNGSRFARLASAGRYAHLATLTSRGIYTLLGKMGTASTSLPVPAADLSVNGPLILSASNEDDVLPTRAASGELMTIAAGLATCRQLSWGGVGDGIEMDLGVYPLSTDGSTRPWSLTSASLLALPTAEEEFDTVSITWGGAALVGAQAWRLSIDTAPQYLHNPGKLYPQYIRQRPATGPIEIVAEVTVPDRSLLRSQGEHFAGGAVANLVITAGAMQQAAGLAAATITLTLTGVAEIVAAADGRPGSSTLRVYAVATGATTVPFTWVLS